jgi:hypothetical protein
MGHGINKMEETAFTIVNGVAGFFSRSGLMAWKSF